MREIRMLRAMRRELETGLRQLLRGHAGGNARYGQGAAYELPRQFSTLPTFRRLVVRRVVENAFCRRRRAGSALERPLMLRARQRM